MRVKNRSTLVEFPVFSNYFVHVELFSDLKKTLAKYPQTKNIPEKEFENSDALTVHDLDGHFSFIFVKHNVSVGTIAHESWHAVNQMMNVMGVEIDSETVAYHLGYLVNEVFRFVRGRK